MNKINAEFLKSQIPISKVINRLKIQRSGTNYHCINPIHLDETPSMSVNEKKNYFHCFGCEASGSIIDLYMISYRISFAEALRQLAIDYNISANNTNYSSQIQEITKNIRKHKYSEDEKSYNFLCLYDQYSFDERAGISENDKLALECIRMERLLRNKIIFQELYNFCTRSGITDDVYSYLSNKRKLSEAVIKKSKIFSIQNYQDTNIFMKSVYDIQELVGAGLFKNDNLIFKDTHRLVIPYLNEGQITYLRARYFDSKENTISNGLKYFGLRNDDLNLNTVKRFYNIDILSELKIYDELFICEGELDCLCLLSIGLNAVAIPGVNSFPQNELNILSDYNITLCFDNDPVGKSASVKLIEAFYNIRKTVNIIELPDGIKDVSDFIIEKYSIKRKS